MLAVAAIASCAKTEPVYMENEAEIMIAPVTSMATKAQVNQAIDGVEYPAAEFFTVIGYWANEESGSDFAEGTTYLDNVVFEKKAGAQYWSGQEEPCYWPKNGSLRFATYSPSDANAEMAHDLATDTWTATGYTQSNDTDATVDFMVAKTPLSYTAQTAAESVSVVFEHALSWISFNVKAQDEAAAEAFVVKNITVNGVNTVADMVAEYPAKVWSNWSAPMAYEVFDGAVAPAVTPVEIENNGVVVIPQATTEVTVQFVQNTLADETMELTIPLTLSENQDWEPGKHYIYTIVFGLDEILINPSVADWEDVYVNDVPATEVVATTEAEFVAAVNNGGQVRLEADIVTTQTFRIYESINIDLNGHTLTANVGDDIFVRVNSGATFTIGRGTVICDDYIVSVNEGGVAVINDGVYTAETTAVNVNGGKAYITGGKFEDSSEYEGQYLLNHVDAQKENGLIEVTGGSFKDFNPAAASSEYPAMDFVPEGYNVTCVDGVYTVTGAAANVTLAAATSAVATYNVAGATLNGNGYVLAVAEGSEAAFHKGSIFSVVNLSGVAAVKDLTIDGNNASYTTGGKTYGARGIYVDAAGEYLVEGVSVKNVTYALNVNTTKDVVLTVKDSVLEGWTSYGTSTTATFDNVMFAVGATQKTYRPQGATVLTGCDFEDGFIINLDLLTEPIVFDNCTYAGVALAAENLQNAPADLVTIQ